MAAWLFNQVINPHWGASLTSGNAHPDAVLHRDKCFRVEKKAYYEELQKYHTDILETLKGWKDKWTRCKDPEKEIVEKMWSTSTLYGMIKNSENSLTAHPNESREHDLEEHHIPTADSSSRVASEQISISNKERTQALKIGERQERKGLGKSKNGNLPITSGKGKAVANPVKDEKPQKVYVRSGDAAKYMSYIKISRKQHQLVKNIKQSGEGIQSKSLNRVLGDIKSFNVKPYKAFEEEEQKKLHEHWLLVACKELPAAFEGHEKKHFQQQQWRKSLVQELADRKIMRDEDEEKDPEEVFNEQGESDGENEHRPTINVLNCNDQNVLVPPTSHSPLLQRIPSLNRPHEPEPMTLDLGDGSQQTLKCEAGVPISPQLLEKTIPAEEVTEPEVYEASIKDVWQGVGNPGSYYSPTSTARKYTSSGESSVRKQQPVDGQPTRIINLETDILEQEAGEHLFCGPSDNAKTGLQMHDGSPLVSSYANQDRSQLLPPFLKGPGMLHTYPNESVNDVNKSGLKFLRTNNSPRENGQFPRQLQDQPQQQQQQQLQLVDESRIRDKELHMNQLIQKNIYSNGRYPTQGLFASGNIQEWASGHVHTAPFHPSVDCGMSGHDWLAGDNQARNGLSETGGSSCSGQCLGGSSSSNADGSLFSVLSQCNKLQSHYQNKSMNSRAHVQSRNSISGATSVSADVFPYTPSQSNYSSMRESSPAANTSWMNLPHSNPSPCDSMEKPFLQSWNNYPFGKDTAAKGSQICSTKKGWFLYISTQHPIVSHVILLCHLSVLFNEHPMLMLLVHEAVRISRTSSSSSSYFHRLSGFEHPSIQELPTM
ncbi:hypothetical protein ACLOJK_019618 [Asimina triloba]